MPFVVDASVIASWLMPDENDPVAQAMAARFASDTASAPALFWFEIRNIFLIAERRGRVTSQETALALALLRDLRIEHPDDVTEPDLLALARKHRLTVYDASYLELALRMDVPLATLDQELVGAAKSEGVTLIGVAEK